MWRCLGGTGRAWVLECQLLGQCLGSAAARRHPERCTENTLVCNPAGRIRFCCARPRTWRCGLISKYHPPFAATRWLVASHVIHLSRGCMSDPLQRILVGACLPGLSQTNGAKGREDGTGLPGRWPDFVEMPVSRITGPHFSFHCSLSLCSSPSRIRP